ncbi:MAG: hypothetical protein D6B27_00345 [Gammaproteobacteria bacterium]|nr:MAG: hypothetical protein D6B27_00345 [Gammaproteobacteria bacterium]
MKIKTTIFLTIIFAFLGISGCNHPSIIKETAKQEVKFWPIEPPLVVNYDNFGRKGFLQIAPSIMTFDSSVLKNVIAHSPVIRQKLIHLFEGRKFENLFGSENQIKLQKEALNEVNRILIEFTGRGGVEKVLFTSYVLQ